MLYMTISSQENHHFSLFSYFRAHPTTLLLKILGGRMHGPSPTSNFGGTVPPSPPRFPPLGTVLQLKPIMKTAEPSQALDRPSGTIFRLQRLLQCATYTHFRFVVKCTYWIVGYVTLLS